VRAATGPETVGESLEVDLVDLVEDRHHGLFNSKRMCSSFLL
jgi:hypothetical protein